MQFILLTIYMIFHSKDASGNIRIWREKRHKKILMIEINGNKD